MNLFRSVQENARIAKRGRLGRGCLVATQLKPKLEAKSSNHTSEFRRGALVKLGGLQKSRELNGSVGKLLHYCSSRQRWDVDVEDLGARSLKSENLEVVHDDTPHKPFTTWLSSADLGAWQLAEVGVLLHLDTLQEVSTSSTDDGKSYPGYKCTFSAVGRARILGICNPEAFPDRSRFLLAHVASLEDQDMGGSIKDEAAIEGLLKDAVALHEKLMPGTNLVPQRWVMDSLTPRPGEKLWMVVDFWKQFLEAHVRIMKLKNAVDSCSEKIAESSADWVRDLPPADFFMMLMEMLMQTEEGQSSAAMDVVKLPPELLSVLQSLRDQVKLTVFDRKEMNRALPLQQLIQAATYREQLHILKMAVAQKKIDLQGELQHTQGISLSETLEQGVSISQDLETPLSKL